MHFKIIISKKMCNISILKYIQKRPTTKPRGLHIWPALHGSRWIQEIQSYGIQKDKISTRQNGHPREQRRWRGSVEEYLGQAALTSNKAWSGLPTNQSVALQRSEWEDAWKALETYYSATLNGSRSQDLISREKMMLRSKVTFSKS